MKEESSKGIGDDIAGPLAKNRSKKNPNIDAKYIIIS